MMPKLAEEACERLWPVIVPELVECRRQLAAWAATVAAWIVPTVPECLYNRGAENWEPLLFVAERAGERWAERARTAAEALSKVEQQPSLTTRLLKSIWKAYQPDPEEDPAKFLSTEQLLSLLHSDPDEDWLREGPGGRHITAAWLRERLRHLLSPAGTQRPDHAGLRGYAFRQFAGAFARYVGPQLPLEPIIEPIASPGASGPSGPTVKKPGKTAKKFGPDEGVQIRPEPLVASGPSSSDRDEFAARSGPDGPVVSPDGPDAGALVAETEVAENAAIKRNAGPDGPDAPDESGRVCGDDIGARPRKPCSRRKPTKADWAAFGRDLEAREARTAAFVPNGEAAPELDLPASPIPPYAPGTWDAALVDEIRRLHEENPKRSVAWLGKRTGQPKSVVAAILEARGGAG